MSFQKRDKFVCKSSSIGVLGCENEIWKLKKLYILETSKNECILFLFDLKEKEVVTILL